MAPLYDRHENSSLDPYETSSAIGSGPDDEAMEDAAEALRQAEVEAVQVEVPDTSSLDQSQLQRMNIDELRAVAKELDVPDRGTITDRDELTAAIRQRM